MGSLDPLYSNDGTNFEIPPPITYPMFTCRLNTVCYLALTFMSRYWSFSSLSLQQSDDLLVSPFHEVVLTV